jgi:DNA helicase-2/ATP-dependent DNA helicase PcrA
MREYRLSPSVSTRRTGIDYERDLNPEQRAVVTVESGPILVIAGAGTGKTRTITYRVAYLIDTGIRPEQVMLATFTNKAAREMLHRVETLLKVSLRNLLGGTFHHIANQILRDHAHLLGYDPNYTILDASDARELLESSVTDLKIDVGARRFPKGNVLQDVVSYAINCDIELDKAVVRKYPYFEQLIPEISRVATRYAEKKVELNMMDFDDLLTCLKHLLAEMDEVRERFAQRFQHILVDEYQDTNLLQAQLTDLLASVHRNILVVGDDSQCIYSFRGAHYGNMMDFTERYPDASVYRLETNYRSTHEILSLANDSISHSRTPYQKVLHAVRGHGSMPALVSLQDVYQQAEFVAQRILELRDVGIPLNDIAVLYRSHYHSMELQMELNRRDIPYYVRSGLRFFEQAHIKDVLAHLKIVHNPLDELSWTRVLKMLPRIGRATAGRIFKQLTSIPDPLTELRSDAILHCVPNGARKGWDELSAILTRMYSDQLPPADMIEGVMGGPYDSYMKSQYSNAGDRQEDIEQLASYALRYDSLDQFLTDLAFQGGLTAEDVVYEEEDDERVVIGTVHQAKGLEWRVVFVIWLADGRFPSARALKAEEGEEEERRLFYVATTRAKDELYLTLPLATYDLSKGEILMKPSRLLSELHKSSYERWVVR